MRSQFTLILSCLLLGAATTFPTPTDAKPIKPLSKTSIASALTFKTWGEAIDPDQDSQFVFGQNNLTIVVPSGDHSLAIERKQMNAPRSLREIKGNFKLQARVTGVYPTSASTIVKGRAPFHGAGLLLWQDQNNYIRLERASVFVQGKHHNYINFEKRENGKFTFDAKERSTKPVKLSQTVQGVSFRLERQNDEVVGWYSVNGQNWELVGTFPVQWANTLKAGFLAGHNTDQGFSPTFEKLQFSQ